MCLEIVDHLQKELHEKLAGLMKLIIAVINFIIEIWQLVAKLL